MLAALTLTLALSGAPEKEAWTKIGVVEGVLLEKRHKRGLWMRCTQRVDVPYELVRDTFLTLEFGDWVESLSEWRVFDRGPGGASAYGRHKLPWPMADRDYYIQMKWEESGAEDKRQMLLTSYVLQDKPEVKGVVRMTSIDDIWVLRRAADARETVIVYVYRANLGGNIPRFLEEAGMRAEGPATFRALIKALRKKQARP